MATITITKRVPNRTYRPHAPVDKARAASLRKAWEITSAHKTPFDELRSMYLGACHLNGLAAQTIRNYDESVKQLFAAMQTKGHEHYQQVTDNDVKEYFIALHGSDYAAHTKHMKFRSIRTLFEWIKDSKDCRALGVTAHDDALPKDWSMPQGRLWIPTPSQLDEFLSAFNRDVFWGFRDYVASRLMVDTGARIEEICNLTIDYFDWDRHMVNLDGKTGERWVPFDRDEIEPELKKWLKIRERFAKNGTRHFFVTKFGGPCNQTQMAREFRELRDVKKVGVADNGCITPHVLRHYFCTYYLINGGKLEVLQQITGHKKIETLMIYVHMANQLTVVREEHHRVSPLKNLKKNIHDTSHDTKRRKMR